MKHIISEEICDFAEIYSENIELISVKRPHALELDRLGRDLLNARARIEMRWEQTIGGEVTMLTEAAELGTPLIDALQSELSEVGEVLQKLLECDRLGVRVATLKAPMCPKFHVDQVPCRLLMTISGQGTEWIAHPDVDKGMMSDRQNNKPPLQSGSTIRQLDSGYWSLLKGGAWDGEFTGVVHRSPHGEGERLFLSIDPVFSEAA